MIGICLLLPLLAMAACSQPVTLEPPLVRTPTQTVGVAPRLLAVRYVRSFGSEGPAPGEFRSPADVAVGPEGHLYVADAGNHRVQILDGDGGFRKQLGSYGWREGELDTPTAVAVSALHRPLVFIGEKGNRRVQMCDVVNEQYRIVLEDREEEPFEPAALATGRRGELYVTDTRSHRLFSVGLDGTIEWIRGGLGWARDQMRDPHGVAVDTRGRLLVADKGNRRLVRLDFAGNPLDLWDTDGLVETPTGVARDEFDRWYVCDRSRHVVLVLDAAGKPVLTFGAEHLREPTGIAVSRSGLTYVADRASHDVKEFRIVNAPIGTGPASTLEIEETTLR